MPVTRPEPPTRYGHDTWWCADNGIQWVKWKWTSSDLKATRHSQGWLVLPGWWPLVVSKLVWDSSDPTPFPGVCDLSATSHTQTLSIARELLKPLDMDLLASCRAHHCAMKLLEEFLFEMSKKTVHSQKVLTAWRKGGGETLEGWWPQIWPSHTTGISVYWQLMDPCSSIPARYKAITWKMYAYTAL